MFGRPIIHLGLVGEMSMHNGKNTPRYWIEENEKGDQRMQGQSGFPSPGGLRGWSTRSSGRTVPRIWNEAASERIKIPRTATQGRGRLLLVHRAHGRLAGFLLRVTGRATPLPEDAFSPTRAAAQVSPSPFFLRVLAREEMASQAGSG